MIACDPRSTVDVHLKADEDKPADKRPTFTYRHFTVSEDVERSRLAREVAADGVTPELYLERLGELLGIGLVSWRNVTAPDGKPVPFEAAKPGDALRALSDLEVWEILGAATRETVLSERQKKVSQSPSPTGPEKSAEPAPAPASA